MEISDFQDIPIDGKIDALGMINQLYGRYAVENALKLWISSFPCDFIRNKNAGGILIPYLSKPLSPEVGKEIKSALLLGLKNEFTPSITINSIEIIPDYDKRRWIINLSGYCSSVQDYVDITVYARSLV